MRSDGTLINIIHTQYCMLNAEMTRQNEWNIGRQWS